VSSQYRENACVRPKTAKLDFGKQQQEKNGSPCCARSWPLATSGCVNAVSAPSRARRRMAADARRPLQREMSRQLLCRLSFARDFILHPGVDAVDLGEAVLLGFQRIKITAAEV
jgi:hypothetical protein